MKYLIIALFVFANVNSFGQENEYTKKHNLLWNFGINHSSNFKPVYRPAFKPSNFYPEPETMHPGYYKYPATNIKSGIVYRFYFFKGFNINVNLNFSYWKYIIITNGDSIKKYYLYSDSTINELELKYHGYEYLGPPLYHRSETFITALNFSVGYRYKRFYISAGIQYPLFEKRIVYSEYKNNKQNKTVIKKNFFTDSFDYSLNTRLEFLVIKQRIPLSVYVELNDVFFFGITLNTTNIFFDNKSGSL